MTKRDKAVEHLAVTLIEQLPDSRKKRREVLQTVLEALPAESEVRGSASSMLYLMEQFDNHQQQLLLEFQAKHIKGDGHK